MELTLGVMYPSKYLKASDLLGRQFELKIRSVGLEDVVMTNGRKERKLVLSFEKTTKLLIAGKTNGYALGVLIGSRAKDWEGKRVVLCADVDVLGRDGDVPCVRIVSSPDAPPARAEAYARAWRGERKRGKLVARLKAALNRLEPIAAPAVEEPEPEQIDESTPEPEADAEELFRE